MKHIGRGIATIAVMGGCVAIGYFTKDGCSMAACMIICVIFIWLDAD